MYSIIRNLAEVAFENLLGMASESSDDAIVSAIDSHLIYDSDKQEILESYVDIDDVWDMFYNDFENDLIQEISKELESLKEGYADKLKETITDALHGAIPDGLEDAILECVDEWVERFCDC